MARPTPPTLTAAGRTQQVSGNRGKAPASLAAAAAVFKQGRKSNPQTDRNSIAKDWQIEAYRQVKICGEARYAATLFAAIAGRAEIGVSEPNSLARKAVWVNSGAEVDAFNELAPTVRERSKLIRDYMLHRIIAGECYLIARERVDTDPGYIDPPEDPTTGEPYRTWDDYLATLPRTVDILDPAYDAESMESQNPNVENPIWEIVAVTEIQRIGSTWQVRHDNGNMLTLKSDDPVIRMWNPDPDNRREAWSPFRSMMSTLREIEWLTAHIFTQVRSRLMSAGVWFLPDNLTFPAPPPDSVEGGAEAIAMMNEAEQFMLSLAASAMTALEPEEVSFPNIVMADPAALAAIDQKKLIQFWSEIDDKAMILRSDAVRRFALGMDLPPEQVLGSSGLAVTGAGGSAGSVNHWGVWANEEQTISAHVEPALDDFVGTLTTAVLQPAIEGTLKVIAYDTATLRLRQDRSKEAIELYDRGELSGAVMLRENGFDPDNDRMDDDEFKRWLLVRITGGSATPEQVQAALALLKVDLPVEEGVSGNGDGRSGTAPGLPGRTQPRSLDDHVQQGPPQEQHDHSDAPFNALAASCEALVLRALEKAGNVLLNDRRRGKDRDRTTPKHLAHLTAGLDLSAEPDEFDFSLASAVLDGYSAVEQRRLTAAMGQYCARLYNEGEAYSRAGLLDVIGA